jgi:hypothetical protein
VINQQYVSTTGCVWPMPEVLGLTMLDCPLCKGEGGVTYAAEPAYKRICHCVYRASFAECLATYQRIQDGQTSSNSTTTQDHCRDHRDWENFLADFEGVAKRNLSEKKIAVFKARVVKGLTDAQCMRALKIDAETLEHLSYQLEVQLGRVYHELQPNLQVRLHRLCCCPRLPHSFATFCLDTFLHSLLSGGQ